jgi:glutamate-1-semialdehyde aminotransferase
LQATTVGPLFFLHWADGPIVTWGDHAVCDAKVLAEVVGGLFHRGIFMGPRGRGCITAAHTAEDVAAFLDALDQVLR